ncbi:MAG: N-acetylglucosamine-6-phosphate deacetylase [Opitutales bacterium]
MKSIEANLPAGGRVRLFVRDGRFEAVEKLGPEAPDLPFAAPGFVDLQLNGYAGVNFSDPTVSPEAAADVLTALWRTGVTRFCPTLVSQSVEGLTSCFRNLESLRRALPEFAVCAPCYHLEGPFLSNGPSAGAHRPEFMRDPAWSLFAPLQEAAGGRIALLTLAPERAGAEAFTRQAVKAGVRIALSHTDGTPGEVHRLAAAGASMNTHLGNGCPQLLDRHEAPFWAQLADDRLLAGLICDGFHLAPDMIRVILKVKGLERCILVSDAVHAGGLPPGPYDLLGKPIELLPSGQVVTADRRSMAGSALTMDRAVAHFRAVTGLSLGEALGPATTVPAAYLPGLGAPAAIAPGEPADFVLFRESEGHLRVEQTYLSGRRVFE